MFGYFGVAFEKFQFFSHWNGCKRFWFVRRTCGNHFKWNYNTWMGYSWHDYRLIIFQMRSHHVPFFAPSSEMKKKNCSFEMDILFFGKLLLPTYPNNIKLRTENPVINVKWSKTRYNFYFLADFVDFGTNKS